MPRCSLSSAQVNKKNGSNKRKRQNDIGQYTIISTHAETMLQHQRTRLTAAVSQKGQVDTKKNAHRSRPPQQRLCGKAIKNGWIHIHPTHTWTDNVRPNLTINNI